MKNITRILLGLLASLFLTLGLVRAAEIVSPDQLAQITHAADSDSGLCTPTADCTSPTLW